jgi:hypothetical protein
MVYKTEPMPRIDAGLIEPGDVINFWDERTSGRRIGVVSKVTDRYYHFVCSGKKKKISTHDTQGLYVYKDRKMLAVVETP